MVTDSSSGRSSLPVSNPTSSFWHREPSKTLLGHRTTSTIPTTADIVIVGSGISGSFAARFLHEENPSKKIVMLEAREACWGATGRNGGHCQPGIYYAPPEVARFELGNYHYLKQLVTDHDIQCEWKTVMGCHPCTDQKMFDDAIVLFNSLKQIHPEIALLATIITPESTNPSLEDLRVPGAIGAFVQRNAASLWPYKLVSWVLESLLCSKSQTFNLQTNTPVTSLQKISSDNSWIVHTPRGMISAPTVLLTTNGYTSALLPKMADLIVPVQGEMSALFPPPTVQGSHSHHALDMAYVFLGHDKKEDVYQDDYLIQRPFSGGKGGELMFGGGRQYATHTVGVSDDSFTNRKAASYLRKELNNVLDIASSDPPKELKASFEWTGIMGYSRDKRPWVGKVSEDLGLGGGEGLWICAGFNGHGMPNTTGSARAVVDLMIGKKPENVNLPGLYRMSRSRVEQARLGDEVHVADAKGFFI